MKESKTTRSKNQQLFFDMTLGILIYAVVLGFFNDYSNILTTKSYSTTFLVAIVMQILTYTTLLLKSFILDLFKNKNIHKALMGLIVWLILFFSKFVFLSVIDVLFGSSVEINGFIGLIIIISTVVVFTKIINVFYEKLS